MSVTAVAESRGGPDAIPVEVVYASADDQRLIALDVSRGTTVEQAIHASGILAIFPEIDLAQQEVGIFSQPVTRDHRLAAGDRVEIYRPLQVDPKAQRRARAREQRARGEGQAPGS
ncbi:RnfH family protein [Spiribacter onubensis]|uniref:UPF0125 protein V6X64_03855 n=1 Tax=Spiribacter onubensis TaxID=3122420 RepID=A0ABV3S7M7_9GAMM